MGSGQLAHTMNIEAIIASCITGLLTSGIVAWFFYRLGRTDTESAYRRFILTLVDMRIRQMIPTRRQSVPEHYDLKDTEHWLACLAEVLTEIGFREDAAIVEVVLGEIRDAPHIPIPDDQQRQEGEAKKKTWEAKIHKRIEGLK